MYCRLYLLKWKKCNEDLGSVILNPDLTASPTGLPTRQQSQCEGSEELDHRENELLPSHTSSSVPVVIRQPY